MPSDAQKSLIVESVKAKPKYVVTPGLIIDFFEFLNHCEAAEGAPVMIIGPTGSGKSLFLNTYQKFFENKKRLKGHSKPHIVWANCAHFGGDRSDPNIARAELFGQMKGAHSSADKDKIGLVKQAENGVLVLEEIGELPLEVQAMLLTFIETGEYRRVGQHKGSETAKVNIVGATNREEGLREDFKYRFFPYYIPHLHRRRCDVLYYLAYKYPKITLSLTRNEILNILSYQWPGKIDRIARLILRDKISQDGRPSAKRGIDENRYRLGGWNRGDTQLPEYATEGILEAVDSLGGDSELLESLLNKFGVGLSENEHPAFNLEVIDAIEKDGLSDLERNFEVKICPTIEQFENAYRGYRVFCHLFMQDPDQDGNPLLNFASPDFSHFSYKGLGFTENQRQGVIRTVKAIMQLVRRIEIADDTDMADDPVEYWHEIEEMLKSRPPEVDGKTAQARSTINDIFDMGENELRRFYYEGLLKRCSGNVKKVAEKARLNMGTLRSRMDSLGINYKRKIYKKRT